VPVRDELAPPRLAERAHVGRAGERNTLQLRPRSDGVVSELRLASAQPARGRAMAPEPQPARCAAMPCVAGTSGY